MVLSARGRDGCGGVESAVEGGGGIRNGAREINSRTRLFQSDFRVDANFHRPTD